MISYNNLIAGYIFSCINVYRRPEDGSRLEPKHVAANKLIKTGTVCDQYLYVWCVTNIWHDSQQNMLQTCETLCNHFTVMWKKCKSCTTSLGSNPGMALFYYKFSL